MTQATTLPLPLARLPIPDALLPTTRLVTMLRRELRRGALTLTLPDGSVAHVEGPLPGPQADIVLHRWRALARLMLGGGTGFADAYVDGDWDSSDPASVVELGAVNREAMTGAFVGNVVTRLAARWIHRRNANTRRGSRDNIHAHYDLGNDFYALWLDAGMTYSSAVYPAPGSTLEVAQEEKYRRLLELLGSTPGQHILEIGCGWGSFACYAARHGMRVTAVTISQAQLAWAQRAVQAAGVADRVDVVLCDYRDLRGTYDHIVSIEMIEAVGEAFWPAYFWCLRTLLAGDGRVALQAITIADALFDDYRRDPDFIQTRIFPGGMLPSPAKIEHHARAAGLRVAADAAYGAHYARTLAEWRARFRAALPAVEAQGFDQRFRRLWDFYLAYCEGGFRAGCLDVHHIALALGR